ncbi:MAG: glycosyltransferase family 2 protein [Paludisphaera borealis]|uniref:glycosyltransferase family 2 protein n=1 Tax=Paludisphaera borealis TaxID=1387353 RepID=UPI00283BE46C|nr:glycosyltransferase family 2 protein [Paludisphaera borealis]MDR3623124.1 glycosyltransferase family 2 protein [Paludisphaera borealis]
MVAILVVGLNLIALPFLAMLLLTALAAVFSLRRTVTPEVPTSKFLIVIPAHDEAVGIAQTVQSCRAQEYPADQFQVLVIADNCTDDTADIAGREGAEVVVRHDPVKKTKGYALEYLIERLQESGRFDRLDAIVIVDADTITSPDLLRKFDALVREGHDWIQCYYTVANPDASWRTRLMTFAFSLVNGVGPLGLYRLGLSSPLNGNGMCFTTRGLRRVPWKSYGLVEDYEFSWVVRTAGERIAFLPDATVKATMLEGGGEAAANQRRRWEFGRKEVKKRLFGPVLRCDRMNLFERFASAVELKTPPMMKLLGLFVILAVLNLAVVFLHAQPLSSPVPLALLGSSLLMIVAVGGYALSPFLVFGLPASYLLTLAYVPVYALWKISVRLGGKPTQWVRTARSSGR